MKKGMLLLAVVAAFALVGCEKHDTDVEGKRKAPKSSETKAADTATSPTAASDAATSPAH